MTDEEHYKQRLRELLPYTRHKNDCTFAQWQIAEFCQKTRGPNYSAGPPAACSCNLTALRFILMVELDIPEDTSDKSHE